jgi:chromosomal replication initiation ATPase DnaA
MSELLASVAKQYGVNAMDIISKSKDHKHLEARRQLVYLAHDKHGHSFPDIASFLGRSSHSSFISMRNTAVKMMELKAPAMVELSAELRLLER